LYHVDTQFDWGHLYDAANSLSLFAQQKIIELRMPSGKPGDKGTKALIDYLQAPSADNILLIVTDKLDSATQKTKWCKALEETGTHVQVWPLTGQHLQRWVSQRLDAAGLRAENDAIALLISRTEGNLLATAQEIEKLILLAQQTLITYEVMASVVADNARYSVFDLTDRALQGDAPAAIKTLHGLRSEGTEPIAILWALTREIRQLVQISTALANGAAFGVAAKQAGVWDKRQPLIQSAIRRLKPTQWQQLLRKANGIDKAIKGMRAADPWDELLDLVLNIAGVQSLTMANERLMLKL
jgi:DNA polymerase-3 subunit delta